MSFFSYPFSKNRIWVGKNWSISSLSTVPIKENAIALVSTGWETFTVSPTCNRQLKFQFGKCISLSLWAMGYQFKKKSGQWRSNELNQINSKFSHQIIILSQMFWINFFNHLSSIPAVANCYCTLRLSPTMRI